MQRSQIATTSTVVCRGRFRAFRGVGDYCNAPGTMQASSPTGCEGMHATKRETAGPVRLVERPKPFPTSEICQTATYSLPRMFPAAPSGVGRHKKRKGYGRGTYGPGPSAVGRGGRTLPTDRKPTGHGGPGVFRPLVGVNRLETVGPFLVLLSVMKEERPPTNER